MNYYSGISVLLVSVLLASCTTKQETKKEEAKQAFPVIRLTRQSTTLDHDYASNLEAVQNVEVRARVAGYLDKILVDEGKAVQKANCFFNSTGPNIRWNCQSAGQSGKLHRPGQSARVEMDRVKLLVDKNIISPSELKLAKAKMETAKAAINGPKRP